MNPAVEVYELFNQRLTAFNLFGGMCFDWGGPAAEGTLRPGVFGSSATINVSRTPNAMARRRAQTARIVGCRKMLSASSTTRCLSPGQRAADWPTAILAYE